MKDAFYDLVCLHNQKRQSILTQRITLQYPSLEISPLLMLSILLNPKRLPRQYSLPQIRTIYKLKVCLELQENVNQK